MDLVLISLSRRHLIVRSASCLAMTVYDVRIFASCLSVQYQPLTNWPLPRVGQTESKPRYSYFLLFLDRSHAFEHDLVILNIQFRVEIQSFAQCFAERNSVRVIWFCIAQGPNRGL